MDDMMSSRDYKEARFELREEIYSKIEKVGSIEAEKILREEFDRVCADAVGGDPVAQDLMAEWFRNGNQIVSENIDISMQWLILAGANGNKFSLERLKLHFGYAFDRIINSKNFGRAAYKYEINEYNYQYVIGQMLCEAVVEDLKINALELAKQRPVYLPFSGVIMRKYDNSITKCVDVIIAFLSK